MIANTLRFMTSPMFGDTRLVGAYRLAAMAASAPEMKNVRDATRLTLMPTRRAPSRFCAIASMVAPVVVRFRK